MKYYLLNFPRPIGVEPKIRSIKPNIEEQDDWCGGPDVEEYDSIALALVRIMNFNSTDDYLKHLEIEDKP